VVVQDLDKPLTYGAAWGEVNGSIHRALGCVGAIIDGGVRDIEELRDVGFKVLAKRLCVGHAFAVPLRWGCGVEVFGRRVEPGQLIHADQHGFLAVPFGEERGLLEATAFMDEQECRHLISRARGSAGKGVEEILEGLEEGGACFSGAVRDKYGRRGEH
jgi:regulator of RNase E activity RraA